MTLLPKLLSAECELVASACSSQQTIILKKNEIDFLFRFSMDFCATISCAWNGCFWHSREREIKTKFFIFLLAQTTAIHVLLNSTWKLNSLDSFVINFDDCKRLYTTTTSFYFRHRGKLSFATVDYYSCFGDCDLSWANSMVDINVLGWDLLNKFIHFRLQLGQHIHMINSSDSTWLPGFLTLLSLNFA